MKGIYYMENRNKTKELILCGIFAALTAIGAFIRIPVPNVPFTLQVFFVIMSGIILGPKLGLISQLTYLFIGFIGIPVFIAGGGPSYILQPTFGYLIGFALAAYVVGKIIERRRDFNLKTLLIASYIGLAVVYLIGVPYLYLIYNLYLGQQFTVFMALWFGFIICVPGDILLMALVSVMCNKIVPILNRHTSFK